MVSRSSLSRWIVTFGLVIGTLCAATGDARAQAGLPPPDQAPPPPASPSGLPSPTAAAATDEGGAAATVSEIGAPADPANAVAYGGAMRLRWVMVPKWLLNLFTESNQPVSSYGVGGEIFRRKDDLDIVIGFGYQRTNPDDGNWLGKGKDPGIDTDFIQFRGFGMIGLDASFIWHQRFNEYVGMHYGAGLGLAFITGDMLRISAHGCNKDNINSAECAPKPCKPNGCTEEILRKTEVGPDTGPDNPARFKESGVPGAIPIINLVLGLNLRFPELKGFEMRMEGGFYNAFYLGLGIAYAM